MRTPKDNGCMNGYVRIQSADEIDDNGAFRLVEEALTREYYDYVCALKRYKKFMNIKKKRRLTKKEKKKVKDAEEEIKECEEFYLSDTYTTFTLGKGPKGREVIEKIKRMYS